MTVTRALVIGAGGAVGRATVAALTDAGAWVLATGGERDATDPEQVQTLLAEADPDLVVVAVGAGPHAVSVGDRSSTSFWGIWNLDVKVAFEVGRAALARPLGSGATVLTVTSSAGRDGSPLSGGHAGAKRMQMFQANQLQRASDVRGLGLRFVALVPQQLTVDEGAPAEAYMSSRSSGPLTPEAVAAAIFEIGASRPEDHVPVLGVAADGVHPIAGA